MRIKEEYKKSGYFWLPDNIDHKIPGTLVITDGGNIELEIIGSFDNKVHALDGNNNLTRIVGHIEQDELVTLENCFYKEKGISFGGISKSLVHVNRVLSGVTYDKDQSVKFNTFSFSVEGLDKWVGITGIEVSHKDDSKHDIKSVNIKYTPQKKITYKLSNDFNLHIDFDYTWSSIHGTTKAEITQKTYLRLSSNSEKELSEFMSCAYKITRLLSFAIDETATINSVTATSKSILGETAEGEKYPALIKIYDRSLAFSEAIPSVSFRTMLFTFSHIKSNAERIINNWISAYDTIAPSLNLYFSVKIGDHKYLESRFLALARALETYHRRTSNENGHEIHLGKRIEMIIEPFKTYIGNGEERKKLINSIVNTRNYLTHYNEKLKSKAVTGRDLWSLCQKMEALFQLHLLKKIGFSTSEINLILKQNYELKQKFKKPDNQL